MSFTTYNQQGQLLLDSEQAVFSFIKSGRLTRLIAHTFESTKREWTTSRWLGTGTKHWHSYSYTPEYCMYYIDVPNAVSPLAGVWYDGNANGCNPIIYLNTGYFDGKARLMFYSNGRLSDVELAKFQIYIFDVNVEKETQVGMNLYDKNGNVTFSSKSKPMKVDRVIEYTRADLNNKTMSVGGKYVAIITKPYSNIVIYSEYDSMLGEYFFHGRLLHALGIVCGADLLLYLAFPFERLRTDAKMNTEKFEHLPDGSSAVKEIDEFGYEMDKTVVSTPAPYNGHLSLVDISSLPFPYN